MVVCSAAPQWLQQRGALRRAPAATHFAPAGRLAPRLRSRARRLGLMASSTSDEAGAHAAQAPEFAYVDPPPHDFAAPPPRPASLQGIPREDVLEVDTHLRLQNAHWERGNPWTDGLPYVPDGDLVALRVIYHGQRSEGERGWASQGGCRYTNLDSECTLEDEDAAYRGTASSFAPPLPASWVVRAGPRARIYFDPAQVNAAIVTMGGLCPGLNDIIRALVHALESGYHVPTGNVLGIRYGLRGFYEEDHPPVVLTCESVESIHLTGGTVLGTSRGGSDIGRIVDSIQKMGLNMCFFIGGNGGNAAADAVHRECIKRGYPCAIVGLPKSIDNDILLIDACFGFDTATAEAQRAILAATIEARSTYHGLGLVKLMGRSSGFIAAQASVAAGSVDACIIPEVPIEMPKLMRYLFERMDQRGHVTVVVAEGACQDIMRAEVAATDGATMPDAVDASGNAVLLDVGRWMREQIQLYAKQYNHVVPDIKYISPAYMIRSVAASTVDKVACQQLAHSAVHGAFAGFSGFTSAVCSRHHSYLPSAEVVRTTRRLDPRGRLYRMMRAALGQPEFDGVVEKPDPERPLTPPTDPDDF